MKMKKKSESAGNRLLVCVLIIAVMFTGGITLQAQTADALTATIAQAEGQEITANTPIEFSLSRSLKPGEKIAVLIEQTDISSLLNVSDNKFTYDPKLVPLPLGKSALSIHVVTSDGLWREIARRQISVRKPEPDVKVETPADKKPDAQPTAASEANGKTDSAASTPDAAKTDSEPAKPAETISDAEKPSESEKSPAFKFLPSFTISMPSQPFQSNFPADSRPANRATFTDFDLTASIKTEGKHGIFSNESNFDFAGSSFKDKTLQFGTLGKKAPDIDLSSYLMNFTVGRAKFSLGHTSFGANRHLVSSFSSRGLSINIPINKRLDVIAGILNGTSVLGIHNFLGMSKIRHQMQGATLGIEFFPKRQNALRLEVSGFNGYLQALNNVSEGRVVDAERSRGFGLRLIASDKSERFKVEAGYALSRFFNPEDKSLDPNGVAVPIPASVRSAHYLETSYQILKDLKLTKTKSVNLGFAFKYEFVEPLFKSLGASASADKFSRDYAIDGSIGDIAIQAGRADANDNLRNVASILKSLTHTNRFSLTLPVTALFAATEKPSPLLPRLGYSIDRTHNFGAGIPVNGGFEIDPSTIPDLMNTNQTFTAGWQFKKFGIDANYNRTFADNRQRDKADEDNLGWVRGITIKVNPRESYSFNFGFSIDSQRNVKLATINETKSVNFGLNWIPFKGATFATEMSQALVGDRAQTSLNRSINYSGQFAYNFSREKSRFNKFGTQAFVRYADAYVNNHDFANFSGTLTRTRILTAGLTVNVF